MILVKKYFSVTELCVVTNSLFSCHRQNCSSSFKYIRHIRTETNFSIGEKGRPSIDLLSLTAFFEAEWSLAIINGFHPLTKQIFRILSLTSLKQPSTSFVGRFLLPALFVWGLFSFFSSNRRSYNYGWDFFILLFVMTQCLSYRQKNSQQLLSESFQNVFPYL